MARNKERTPRRVNVAVNSSQMKSEDDYSTSKCFAIASGILVVLFAVYALMIEYAKAVLC